MTKLLSTDGLYKKNTMKLDLILFGLLVAASIAITEQSLIPTSVYDKLRKYILGPGHRLKKLDDYLKHRIISPSAGILTDGLQLNPTKEVKKALQSGSSTEGIFNATADLIVQRATRLAQEEYGGPSHEGILDPSFNIGPLEKYLDSQQFLSISYDPLIHENQWSHEEIQKSLGGLVFNGLDELVGGEDGKAIKKSGNILGNLLYVAPQSQPSQEGILDVFNKGILSSAGDLISEGAASVGKHLIKTIYKPYSSLLGNIFLARGHYKEFKHIHEPGKEAILQARNILNQYPNSKTCADDAERVLTHLLDEYVHNSSACVNSNQRIGQRVIAGVYDIVLDSAKRIEDLHRTVEDCFNKQNDDNKLDCVRETLPQQIDIHTEKVNGYGPDLTKLAIKFTDINTRFDVCLTKQIGVVKSEIYDVVYKFQECLDNNETI